MSQGIQSKFLGSLLRGWGQKFEAVGKTLQGSAAYTETMGKHRTITAFQGNKGALSSTFVAPCASVIGNVNTGKGSSLWYGAVLRGDVNEIRIGSNSAIGERAVVHCASAEGSVGGAAAATVVGDNVYVGALSILHACTIADGASIGVGSTILDGVKVGAGAIVEAASTVSPGKVIPAGEVWGGVPAAFIRKVSPDEAVALERTMSELSNLARIHAEECNKSWDEVEFDKETAEDARMRDPDHAPTYNAVITPRVYGVHPLPPAGAIKI